MQKKSFGNILLTRQRKSVIRGLAIGVALGGAIVMVPKNAAALQFTLGTVINGDSPTSTPPWLTGTFANGPGADTVTLTLKVSLNVASEFIDEVKFNLDPAIVPSSVTITQSSGTTATAILHTTQNAQDLNGGGNGAKGFDIEIEWPTANNADRFDGTETAVFTLVRTGLTESSFNFTNTLTQGQNTLDGGLHMAAHVQGIPTDNGTTSGAIADPDTSENPKPVRETSGIILMVVGIVILGKWVRSRGESGTGVKFRFRAAMHGIHRPAICDKATKVAPVSLA